MDAVSHAAEGFRLSPQQERLWAVLREDPSWPARVQALFELDGELPEDLTAALRDAVARHEILRTRFRDAAGLPLQVVGADGPCAYRELDLRGATAAAAEEAVATAFAEAFLAPCEPEAGGGLTAVGFRCGPGRDRLLISLPALCGDRRTLRNLAHEILAGPPAEEGPQYADLAEAFRQILEGPGAAGVALWRRLEGLDPFAAPLRGTRGARDASPVLGTVEVEPGPATAERLDARARDLGVPLAALLAACWLALLYRLHGDATGLLGVAVDGRGYEGLPEAVGLFARALPLRVELGDHLDLDSAARAVQAGSAAVEQWQEHFPWRDVWGSGAAFAPYGFDFDEDGGSSPIRLRTLREAGWCDRFHVRLSARRHGDRLSLSFVHDRRVCAPEAMATIAERFLSLLESCLAAPGSPLGEWDVLTAGERRGLRQPVAAGDETFFHHLFAVQVRRAPEAAAVLHAGSALSYRELDERAERLAAALAGRGVGPAVPVAVAVERSPAMVAAVLAIAKAGGAFVPVDPAAPAERRESILRDSGARLLLTLREGEVSVAELEGAAAAGAGPSGLHGDHPAYILYTSGSTGRPKGVVVPHAALLSYLRWCVRAYGLGPGSMTPVHSPLGFDFTLTSLLAPLLAGGTAVLVPEGPGFDGLVDLLASGGPWGLLKLTPAHLEPVAQRLLERGAAPRIDVLVVGGEALLGESLDLWAELSPGTRVVNEYGPTEVTVGCAVHELPLAGVPPGPVPIGRPAPGVRLFLLNACLSPVPDGVPGEICLGGPQLARGYAGLPALTAGRFVPDPFAGAPGARLYRTGDLARRRPDGAVEFLGRLDRQVKIRGIRIEPGEIEAVLVQHPTVRSAVVAVHEAEDGERRLDAYLVCSPVGAPEPAELREHARRHLPEPLVPATFTILPSLPLTPSGKVDRAALPRPESGGARAATPYEAPRTSLEREIAALWAEVLQVERVGLRDNFFDLGGHSLLLARVRRKLQERLGRDLSMVELFRYPTVVSLAAAFDDGSPDPRPDRRPRRRPAGGRQEIAIVGASLRLPGAATLEELRRNLRDGVESVSFFSEEELLQAGTDPEVIRDPAYVPARGILDGIEGFDAAFFGFSPREAVLTDPQHRIFLECAWEALEHAGYRPEDDEPGRVGVFAGVGFNKYLFEILADPELARSLDTMQTLVGNDKDFLPTRVSYKLGLRGPSVNVQTACSTSLVAVHLACQSLRQGECDMALVGGVSVRVPQCSGYFYQEGGIASPDGHCRAFDAGAQGTLPGNGAAAVVLKRLDDALAARDTIHAVIKGSAINNDGSRKIGYTAPSVDGQAAVIRDALEAAGTDPDTITYVEAHGTGTALGDPIELTALAEAFGERSVPCALGSIKTNFGHLDAAAGVAGLLKAVLALEHREIPPSLHFSAPNPGVDLARTGLYVNTALAEWPAGETPRRAGVSAFGIGGTNCHVILEEPPPAPAAGPSRPWQVLPLSARTPAALDAMTDRLAGFLESRPEVSLPDLAYTLQVGRRAFEYGRAVLCQDRGSALRALRDRDPRRLLEAPRRPHQRPVVFLFPGQGSQRAGMGSELYAAEPAFRDQVDRCAALLEPHLGFDLRPRLFAPAADGDGASALDQTGLAQPALFVVEYSLARLWMEWGVRPVAMAGHSVGEYVAACLAGVLTLPDALALVAARGQLMQELPAGGMLSVGLPAEEIVPRLPGGLSLAAVNGPGLSVVSGPGPDIAALERELAGQGVHCRRLRTSHAFHSSMVEPILGRFAEAVRRIGLRAPSIPFLSGFTGTWIRPEEATDPDYWVRQLRHPVRFSDNLLELAGRPDHLLLEVGPGRSLTTLATRDPRRPTDQTAVASLPKAETEPETGALAGAVARLWLAGVEIDWRGYARHQSRRRIPAPAYPFERQAYWPSAAPAPAAGPARAETGKDLADWFYTPSWKKTAHRSGGPSPASTWLLFADAAGLAERIGRRWEERGGTVVRVEPGRRFARREPGLYEIDPRQPGHYRELLEHLRTEERLPDVVAHLWAVDERETPRELDRVRDLGFYSLLFLAQALAPLALERPIRLTAVSTGAQPVTGQEPVDPAKSLVLGPCRSLPQEIPNLSCRSLDLVGAELPRQRADLDRLIAEIAAPDGEDFVAWRGGNRWIEAFERVRLEGAPGIEPLRERGVYLITGGFGGMGLELAHLLAQRAQARLVLVGRTPLPGRESWDGWIEAHGPGDPVSRKLRRLQDIEAAGGEVLIAAADVTREEDLRRVLDLARRRFGRLHGVIHTAGVPPSGPDTLKTAEAAARVLAPKVDGTLLLAEAVGGEELDFFVLCSSLAAVLSQFGRSDYAAANCFEDAFAHARQAAGHRETVTIGWEAWRDTGMSYDEAVRLGRDPAEAIPVGLSSRQGGEALLRALRSGLAQVQISILDLPAEVARSRREGRAAVPGPAAPAPDRPAGRHPRPPLDTPYVGPRDATERTIAEIWQEVLGLAEVGIHDNFFELGGDSLVSLQIAARLNRAGLHLTPRQVFDSQTVAELAAGAGQAPAAAAEQGIVVGDLPLTPVQQWFLDQEQPEAHHWNLSLLLETPDPLDPVLLRRVVEGLLTHHDALRCRFRRTEEGWVQTCVPPGGPVPFVLVDLSALPAARRAAAQESCVDGLQTSLDLGAGPLLRVALFRLGDRAPGRLLLIAHHLVTDADSWRLLLEDLSAGYARLAAGAATLGLPAKTTSLREWAHRLRAHADDPALDGELDFWLREVARPSEPLPRDLPGGANTAASARAVSLALDEEATQRLQAGALARRVQIEEALLTALLLALHRWAGLAAVRVDLEGHGREPIAGDLDLSRTVGWFTTLAPLTLDLAGGGGDPASVLAAVGERLRALPRRGFGYGLLRFLRTPDERVRRLREEPPPEVSFLYLRQLEPAAGNTSFRPAAESGGPPRSPRGLRPHVLDVSASLAGGRLRVSWTYSENLHLHSSIERLGQELLGALAELADHCLSGEPARDREDFPQVALGEQELDDLLTELSGYAD